MGPRPQLSAGKGRKLDSWKEIAEYLGRDVRSAQRWEHARGLPVYRVPGSKSGGVFAYSGELDEWLHRRRDLQPEGDVVSGNLAVAEDIAAGGDTLPSEPLSFVGAHSGVAASKKSISRRARWVWLLVAVAVFTAATVIAIHRWRPPAKPASGRVMLAVLPFLNLSGDPSQEYFVDGLTEEMITDLGKLNPQAMGVIARTSAMKYKNSKQDISQIGHALGVGYVLEGSVRREGNVVRVSAQLIQVSDQSHLWAQNYQRDVKDILSVQSDVAQAIADKVQVKLSPQRKTQVTESKTANPQAYDDYLKGLYAWNQRTVASMSKGVEFFQQAIKEDPNYAAAYAGMAQCYTLMGIDRVSDAPELLAKAKASALRAVELDDSSAEAHVALGGVRVFADFDWQGAEAEFRRAIELNPNDALAHHWYANLYLDPQGRYEEAIAEMKQAQELDPLSLIINTDLGYAYYVAGADDEATSQFQKVLEMDPNFVPARYDLSLLYLKQKNYEAAWRERTAEMRISTPPQLVARIEKVYARGGYRAVEQERAASEGTFDVAGYPKSAWDTAQAHMFLGEKEQAISFLEVVYQQRNPAIIYIYCDPFWRTLRSEPRFQSLEREVGVLQ